MSDPINHLINGELELFKQSINSALYAKVGQAFSEKKKEIAQELFSEEEECSSCGDSLEEKVDKAKFAALAPPHDKITYADKIAGAKMKKKGKK